MLPEELRCMQEEICCWRRYVIEGDILLEEICCWKRYQRRYLAKGGTQQKEPSLSTRNPTPDEYIYFALVLYLFFVPLLI